MTHDVQLDQLLNMSYAQRLVQSIIQGDH
jgi:hypothetical protein